MYELLNKSGEVITKRHANSMQDAINIFSKIKVLDVDKLLEIYEVKYSG